MLSDARPHFFTHPHLLLASALCIACVSLGANLVGEGLRDALDVRFSRFSVWRLRL